MQPDWVYNSEIPIDWFTTAPEVVIISSGGISRGIAQSDGFERWRFHVPPERLQLLPYTHLALLNRMPDGSSTRSQVTLIDISSGVEHWQATGLTHAFGSFLVPQRKALLLHGVNDAQRPVLSLLDLETGATRWTIEDPFQGKVIERFGPIVADPLFDSESTVIIPIDDHTLRKYDLTDGRLLWEIKDLKPAASLEYDTYLLSGIPRPLMVLSSSGREFLVPHHNTVSAFSTHNGARRWLNPSPLGGIPVQLEGVSHGLLVRVTPQGGDGSALHWIVLLDTKNGRELWRCPGDQKSFLERLIFAWLDSTSFLIEENRLIVAGDGSLFQVPLTSGQEEEFCKLNFDGADEVLTLEVRDDQYVVTGSQNVVWCDRSGKVTRHVYINPPDGFEKGVLSLAFAALINTIEEIQIANVTVTMQADYGPALKELLRDYQATVLGVDYVYMLAESEGGPQLVRIGKDDGREHGRIPVQEQNPEYLVCPYSGNLIWKSSERSLACFTFQ